MMQDEMMNRHKAVNPERNPVVQSGMASPRYLGSVARQYVQLVLEIVDLLGNVRTQVRQQQEGDGWDGIAGVLTKNIGEELGSETDGIAHKTILIEGLRAYGFDITADPRCEGTEWFLMKMHSLTREFGVYGALGAAYALEASAVPELIIVRSLIESLLEMELEGELDDFFRRHVGEFEPGHEEDLRIAVATVLDAEYKRSAFMTGFRGVMTAMDRWWEDMHRYASA